MKRGATTGVLALGLGLACSSHAHAEPDTFHRRAAGYWVGHASITVGSWLADAAISRLVGYSARPMCPSFLDAPERGQQSNTASGLSSGFYLLQLIEPLPAWANEARAPQFFHGSFMYGEALSVSFTLSSLAAHAIRPRPYAYDPNHPELTPDCRHLPEGACSSFYSARASGAFTAALMGSYVFSELYAGSQRDAVTGAAWGMQLGLAALSTGLQVKAGEAFLSDALVGAVVGTSIGGGLYLAHSRSLAMTKWQGVGAGVGLLTGSLIAAVFPSQRSTYGSFLRLVPLDLPATGLALIGTL